MPQREGNPRLARTRGNTSPAAGGHAKLSDVDSSSSSYSRYSRDNSDYATGDVRMGSGAVAIARKKRKAHKRNIMIIVICIVVALMGAAGAAWAYISNINSNLHSGVDSSLLDALIPVDTPSEPFYVLLLGTDGSLERDQTEEYANSNYRSDSMMLARIDPKNKKTTLLSIPRDTKIDLGKYGTQKINAALAFGGPALAVKTVSELAGVPITHYAEINFDGFSEIVDSLGGIDVNIPMEIDDDMAGGYVAAGQQTLNGEQALIVCRSRHNYDDYGDGDALRTANQRLVLGAIAQKLLSVDPMSLSSTVTKLSEYVVTDLSVDEIVSLALSMKGLDAQSDIYTGTAPTESVYESNIWYEILDKKAFKEMMERVDQGLPPTEEDEVDSATGIIISSTGDSSGEAAQARDKEYKKITKNATIRVRNGNGRSGISNEAVDILKEMGYSATNIDTGNADSFDYDKTLIIYKDRSDKEEAQQIADTFGVGKVEHDNGTYLFDSDYLIVIGQDWSL